MSDTEGQICKHCGEWKEYSEFPRNRGRKGGLSSWCRKCANNAVRISKKRAPVEPIEPEPMIFWPPELDEYIKERKDALVCNPLGVPGVREII